MKPGKDMSATRWVAVVVGAVFAAGLGGCSPSDDGGGEAGSSSDSGSSAEVAHDAAEAPDSSDGGVASGAGSADADGLPTEDEAAAEPAADAEPESDGGPSGATWSGTVAPFFETYCAGCHAASPKDFREYDDVVAWSDDIRCGVAPSAQPGCGAWPPPRQFPIGGGPFPSDEERQMVVDWIDAGAPE